jgi:hypothetical protein
MDSEWLLSLRKPNRFRYLVRSVLDSLPREGARRPRRQSGVPGYCLGCRRVTSNEQVVVGHLMKGRRCQKCGRVMHATGRVMAECYCDEFVDRLGNVIQRAKPSNLRRLKGHLHEIPMKVVGKALREAAYVSDLLVEDDEWSENG